VQSRACARAFSFLAIPLLLWVFGLPAASGEDQAAGTGVIEGRVIHQADEAESLAGAVVTLRVFSDQSPVESIRGVTGEDGRFSFQGLDTGPDRTYVPSTKFREVLYFGEWTSFGETTHAERDLIVYDTTTDDSTLGVLHEHIVLGFRPGALTISQFLVIGNNGDRTIVGRKLPDGVRGTLRLTLPEQAFGFEEFQGLRHVHFTKVPGGIVYDSPIIPGTSKVAFRYMVPYHGATTVTRQLDYPTEEADVFVKEAGVDVAIDGLESKPDVTIRGEQYLVFRGSNLAKGAGVAVTVTAIPGQLAGRTLLVLMLICAVGLGVVGYVYPFVWRHDVPSADLEGRELWWVSKYRQSAEGRSLVKEIAELDDLYYEGQIEEADYQRKRRARKRQLVGILDS